MKKSLSILGMLILISSVVLAGGIDNPLVPSNMAIVKTNTGARVFYSTEKVSQVRIRIYNVEDEQEVFSDVIKSRATFSRLYNLQSLPEGEYRIVMEDENGIREELFSNRKKVEVLSSIIYSKKHQKCLVTLYSEQEADISVRVLDKDKNVLNSGALFVNGQAAKLFNLEQINGQLTVEVFDGSGVLRSSVIGN